MTVVCNRCAYSGQIAVKFSPDRSQLGEHSFSGSVKILFYGINEWWSFEDDVVAVNRICDC